VEYVDAVPGEPPTQITSATPGGVEPQH
jgi:hypothetical protein